MRRGRQGGGDWGVTGFGSEGKAGCGQCVICCFVHVAGGHIGGAPVGRGDSGTARQRAGGEGSMGGRARRGEGRRAEAPQKSRQGRAGRNPPRGKAGMVAGVGRGSNERRNRRLSAWASGGVMLSGHGLILVGWCLRAQLAGCGRERVTLSHVAKSDSNKTAQINEKFVDMVLKFEHLRAWTTIARVFGQSPRGGDIGFRRGLLAREGLMKEGQVWGGVVCRTRLIEGGVFLSCYGIRVPRLMLWEISGGVSSWRNFCSALAMGILPNFVLHISKFAFLGTQLFQ
ncbi:hypothetical protein R6Q59_001941 [Mikania micrantha]